MDVKKLINYERLFFKVLMSFSLLTCIILIAIFVLYTHGKHLADTCNFNVITLSGVPYESADDKFELTGNFVRARDGDIWLMGLDTSVVSVKQCLIQKGYDESILDRIELSDTMPHVTP
ncbi:hypothetical protein [Pantoea ananatis]|uniref:hypothetical protein n=1 Tax=Pantoea ananas TaxID=553 RepID=UPI000CF3D917|nr:hypothetical protein [Pantoea ananatis]PQK76456.1 hypothetical protein CG427_06815 [Pantoea ananatis]